jgi:hypothetical protein
VHKAAAAEEESAEFGVLTFFTVGGVEEPDGGIDADAEAAEGCAGAGGGGRGTGRAAEAVLEGDGGEGTGLCGRAEDLYLEWLAVVSCWANSRGCLHPRDQRPPFQRTSQGVVTSRFQTFT